MNTHPNGDARRTQRRGSKAATRQHGAGVHASAACDTPRRFDLLALVLLVVAGSLAYSNSLNNAFVYDDLPAIVENPNIRSLWPPSRSLSAPLGTNTSGRPVVALSLALNYRWGGLDVTGYHIFNILAHVLTACVLYGIVRRTLVLSRVPAPRPHPAGFALAVALLWVVHPLQTAALNQVVYRNEILAGFFYLCVLYAALRAAASRQPAARFATPAVRRARAWSIVAVVACFLGVASKEIVATAPLAVLLFDRAFLAGSFRGAWRQRRGLYVSLASSWILLAVLMWTGNRGASVGLDIALVSPADYARTQLGVLPHYLRVAFWPDRLILDYRWPVARALADVAIPGLVVAALLAATTWSLFRAPRLGFLGAWFFVILAPTSSVIPITGAIAAEHRMYLPLASLITLSVVGVWWLGRALPAPARRTVLVALLLAVAAALTTRTIVRNRDYRSRLVIWTETARQRPGNARAHSNLASILTNEGRYAEARVHLARAVEAEPSFGMAHYNWGHVDLAQGHADSAIARFEAASRLMPDFPESHHNLANVFVGRREFARALLHYRRTLEVAPDHAGALNNLAWLLATCPDASVRDGAAAVRYAERALQASSASPVGFSDTYAAALAEAGRYDAAIAAVEQALRALPASGNPTLRQSLLQRLELYRERRPYRMPTP